MPPLSSRFLFSLFYLEPRVSIIPSAFSSRDQILLVAARVFSSTLFHIRREGMACTRPRFWFRRISRWCSMNVHRGTRSRSTRFVP